MRILLLVGLIVFAQPAQACHRFSVWKYPFPQRCGVITRVAAKPVIAEPSPPVVIATPPPAFDENVARQKAIEELKHRLSAILISRDP